MSYFFNQSFKIDICRHAAFAKAITPQITEIPHRAGQINKLTG